MALDIARQLVGFWWEIFFFCACQIDGNISPYPRSQAALAEWLKHVFPLLAEL